MGIHPWNKNPGKGARQMIRGMLSIRWENSPAPEEARSYKLRFFPATGSNRKALKEPARTGQEALRDYLLLLCDPEMPTERCDYYTNQRLLELHHRRRIEMYDISLTEDQFAEFE
jgi:hypothetical protein